MLRNVLPLSISPTSQSLTNMTSSSMLMTPVTISSEPINSFFLTRHDTVDFLQNQTLNFFNTTFNVFDDLDNALNKSTVKDIKLDVYQEKYGEVIRLVKTL